MKHGHLRYDWWRDQGYFRPNSDTCKNSGNVGGIGKKRSALPIIIMPGIIITTIIIIITTIIIITKTNH